MYMTSDPLRSQVAELRAALVLRDEAFACGMPAG